MYRRETQTEWESNVDKSLTFLDSISGGQNPEWIKALRSALRIARDFDRNVKVMWNGKEYHIYGEKEMCFGNFDVCLTNGYVIH